MFNPLIVTKKMKKVFFTLAAVAVFASCSNSTETSTGVDSCAVDSTCVDSTAMVTVDSVVTE
jgi:uncharacterized lipoprotein YajG